MAHQHSLVTDLNVRTDQTKRADNDTVADSGSRVHL
jgi:hypothetical protein